MSEVTLMSPQPTNPDKRPATASTNRRRKLLVGSVVPLFAWIAWAGHAWAEGCCCG